MPHICLEVVVLLDHFTTKEEGEAEEHGELGGANEDEGEADDGDRHKEVPVDAPLGDVLVVAHNLDEEYEPDAGSN